MEADIGYTIRKKMNVDELYMDRDSQIDAIEKTFRDAQKEITQHYSKPHVHPVEILPVMPDSEMWKYPCAQVIFDSDPAPAGVSPNQQNEQMGQAMIRGGGFISFMTTVTHCDNIDITETFKLEFPTLGGGESNFQRPV